MKRIWLVVMLLSVLLCAGPLAREATAAEQPTAPAWGNSAPAATASVVRVRADSTELTAVELRKGLTWKQRRGMGLTFRNVRKILGEMQKAGDLEGKDSGTLAVEVLDRLVDEQPTAFQNAALDWDAILSFLEKLIPLIIKIISLFS